MSIVKVNNNRSLVPIASSLAIGATKKLGSSQLFWDGVKWVGQKAWNRYVSGSSPVVPTVQQSLPGVIVAPVSVTRKRTGSMPKFRSASGKLSVSHREYVSNVVFDGANFSTNFPNTVADFSVNPLNANLFTWLPSIAANYDRYVFRKVQLQYRPLVPTTQPGRIGLFFDKDSEDKPPTTRAELANYLHLAEISPWGEVNLDLPVDNVVRFTADNVTADPKLVNFGKLGWASYGNATGNVEAGEIFIDYTVELTEPQPTTSLIQSTFIQPPITSSTFTRGPNFVLLSQVTATGAQLVFGSNGRFNVTVLANVTTSAFNVPTMSNGAGKIVNSFAIGSIGRFVYVAQVVITSQVELVLSGLTGMSGIQAFVVRSTAEETVQLI